MRWMVPLVRECSYTQASLEVSCACERKPEKVEPSEKVECNRWPDADLGE